MSTEIGKVDCPARCGAEASVTEAKAGALQIMCPECKSQTFVKSPKAVTALRSHVGGGPPGPAAKPGKEVDDGNWLKKL